MRPARALGSISLGLLAAVAGAALGWAGAPAPTLANVVGMWEGAWFNTTYETTGAARIRIEAEGSTGTLGVDLDGNVFGMFDPPEVVFTSVLGAQSMSKDDDSLFGDVDCSGNPSGFSCTGNMINDFVLSGSITGSVDGEADTAHADYTLNLFGNQMAAGTIDVTKVPEAASAAPVAAIALALLRLRRPPRS